MEKIRKIINAITKANNKNETNKKVIRYLSFVAIATIFWFLNALSKDYTIVVSYPVNYMDMPKDKALIQKLPDKLSLEVKGYGFALLRYKISTAFLPISFNINNYTNNMLVRNNKLDYTIYTNSIKGKISKQLSKDITVLSISPDTIGLHFAKIIEKKVPIKANIKVSFANQYGQSGLVITSPDSITIYAPSIVADTINEVYTELLTFNDLKKSIKRNVPIYREEGIKYEFKRTIVQIPVEQFVESSKYISITSRNLPDSMSLRTFPEKIKVKFRVGMSKYSSISEKDFSATVNYNYYSNQSNVLKVNLDKFPKNIQNIEITPSKVEYIVEKRNQ